MPKIVGAGKEAQIEEKFDSRDLVQISVGSFAGALTYAYQTDVVRLAGYCSLALVCDNRCKSFSIFLHSL